LIYAPALERLFFSYGSGLVFEEASDGRRRSLCGHIVTPRQPIVLVSRSHLDPETKDLLTALQPCTVRKLGSSLKFALIAAREADAYIRLSPTMIWDCAAGLALIEAAGGVVLRTDGSPLLEGTSRTPKIDGFVAALTPQFAQWIEAAQKRSHLGVEPKIGN
jgi:3'(2'), 5'-bisphosphate nucleotidase